MIDILARVLNAILMIGMPIGLFLYVKKKISHTWRFIRIGVSTFIVSQAFHIPFNMITLPALMGVLGLDSLLEASGMDLWIVAIFLGLSAGLFEEVSRYLVYRYWLTDSERTWKNAVTLGAGHGGCESILVGVLALQTLIQMIVLRDADLTRILPPDKVEALHEQVAYYWSLTWYEALMPSVERVSAMTFHVDASVLVLQVFWRNNCLWLGAAISFHAFIDTFAVVATIQKWNLVLLEIFIALIVIPLSSTIILSSREDDDSSVDQAQADFHPIPQRDDSDAELDDPSLVKETDSFHRDIA